MNQTGGKPTLEYAPSPRRRWPARLGLLLALLLTATALWHWHDPLIATARHRLELATFHRAIVRLRTAKPNPNQIIGDIGMRAGYTLPQEWNALEAGLPLVNSSSKSRLVNFARGMPICWAIVRTPGGNERLIRASQMGTIVVVNVFLPGSMTQPPTLIAQDRTHRIRDVLREGVQFLPGTFGNPPDATFSIRFRVGGREGHLRGRVDDANTVTFARQCWPPDENDRNSDEYALEPDQFSVAHLDGPALPTRRLQLDSDDVTDIAIRDDGAVIVPGKTRVTAWQPATGQKLFIRSTGVIDDEPPISDPDLKRMRLIFRHDRFAFSRDLSRVAVGNYCVIDLATEKIFVNPGIPAFDAQFLDDHTMIGCGPVDQLGWWDLSDGSAGLIDISGMTKWANLCSAAAGVCALNDLRGDEVVIVDPAQKRVVARVPGKFFNESNLSLSPDGHVVAISADYLFIYNVSSGELIWRHRNFRSEASDRRVRWSRDGSLATVVDERYAYVWDTSPPTFIVRLPLPQGEFAGDAALSPDGRLLAVLRAGVPEVWIWDLKHVIPATRPAKP